MDANFYQSARLIDLVEWTKPMHNRLNWLFVVLDSSQNILAAQKYIAPKLIGWNASFKYRVEGLWLFNEEVAKPYIRDGIIVPFSACYIFDTQTKSCPKPSFNMTTDLERPFTDAEISRATAEIERIGAIGYAADGVGLQWISSNDELTKTIRLGFKLWQENWKAEDGAAV